MIFINQFNGSERKLQDYLQMHDNEPMMTSPFFLISSSPLHPMPVASLATDPSKVLSLCNFLLPCNWTGRLSLLHFSANFWTCLQFLAGGVLCLQCEGVIVRNFRWNCGGALEFGEDEGKIENSINYFDPICAKQTIFSNTII